MKRKRNTDNLNLGYFVVGFMDMLGQQQHLRNLDKIPLLDQKDHYEEVVEQLRNTYGAVMKMRKDFTDSFNGFKRKIEPPQGLNQQQRKELKSLNNQPIKLQAFSDSVIIYMPLSLASGFQMPIRGIWGIFGGVATTFLTGFARKNPIRGAIDVGLGMAISRNEFYGPALARAYALESKIAQYPRVVVGDEMIKYLKQTATNEKDDIVSRVSKVMAQQCLNCLAEDFDGYPIIDYLGESYLNTFGDVIDRSVIKIAYDNIMEMNDNFQKSKNTKLAFRYAFVRSYFDQRVEHWLKK